jgi:murein DD-endopeptidase MepM/ murein hydrolase activator NlpD
MVGMKSLLIGAVALSMSVALVPVVLAGGDSPPPPLALPCHTAAGAIEPILETIRTLESSGNYRAEAGGSTASGAYQFLDSTWNGYGGYTHAADAPPASQDAKAIENVNGILAANGNDVTAVPVTWYIGHVPAAGSAEWDTVPYPDAGNTITPRQYVAHWMDIYARVTSGAAPSADTNVAPASCGGGSVPPIDGEWSLPGPIELIDANPDALTRPHHDYPAWDWGIPLNTPIYAVHGGTLTAAYNWAFNWWDQNCGENGGGSCDLCGVGLVITDTAGTEWTYCHGNQALVGIGTTVVAGQQIMWSGNTGHSTGPHLHFGIRTSDGVARCPQDLLVSLFRQERGASSKGLPTNGCTTT